MIRIRQDDKDGITFPGSGGLCIRFAGIQPCAEFFDPFIGGNLMVMLINSFFRTRSCSLLENGRLFHLEQSQCAQKQQYGDDQQEDVNDPVLVYAHPMTVIATTEACEAIIRIPLEAGSGAG